MKYTQHTHLWTNQVPKGILEGMIDMATTPQRVVRLMQGFSQGILSILICPHPTNTSSPKQPDLVLMWLQVQKLAAWSAIVLGRASQHPAFSTITFKYPI